MFENAESCERMLEKKGRRIWTSRERDRKAEGEAETRRGIETGGY